MSYKEEIIDYEKYRDDIDHWISIKGEQKYMQFINLFKKNNIPVTWNELDDTCKYDKRLLVNLFKYLSFFEEFLRAQIWNYSNISYKRLEKDVLRTIITRLINLENNKNIKGFSIECLNENKEYVIYLRNNVSHNKIILESKKKEYDIKKILEAFKNTLPQAYQKGFKTDINNCSKDLKVPESLIINIL